MEAPIRAVAVVGGGLVGLGWTVVFARSGVPVRVFDADAGTRGTLSARLSASLADMARHGLVDDVDAIAARVRVVDTLAEALAGADYVQESVFERVDVKTAVSREIGALLRPGAAVGSSSSGIPASAFTAEAPNRDRFLVVHPVNPPHLVPLVELVPAPWTDPALVPWLRREMERLGQVPVVVNREIEGFVLNRLQGALLNEAWALYEAGVASAADIDKTVAEGLGFRWSFMGPFETIDLNAPGGIADYARRLGPLYHGIARSRTEPRPWDGPLIDRVEAERRTELPATGLRERAAWRDRRLMALVAHRRKQPPMSPETGPAAFPETPSFRLDGRRALVTGAGRGIGAAAALALGAAGADVTLASRTAAEIEAVAAEIRRRGGTAGTLAVDVNDALRVAALLAGADPFDILVNNAGTNRPAPFIDVSPEDYDHVFGLNVRSAFFVAQAVARRMVASGRAGSIINVSSQMGHVGAASRTVYCATKHALEGLTKAMAAELGPKGIRVNSLCPTFIETPMTAAFLADPAFRGFALGKIKLGRLGRVEDVMGAIVFLASDAAALMTGSALMLDGGWTSTS